ncbi:hypothetical protein MP228_002948 [Amoeboaphelidium protococcarum]|nr:hypothetical protein MP228_002948 [Amoeboaphelidium protococcarum]
MALKYIQKAAISAGTCALSVIDAFGGWLADALGITTPKYQEFIDEDEFASGQAQDYATAEQYKSDSRQRQDNVQVLKSFK